MNDDIPRLGHSSSRTMKSSRTILIIAIVVALIGLGVGGYFYYQYTFVKSPEAIQKAAQEETKKLVAEIGKVMVLPANETPTLATVSDINQLKKQPFFKDAKNGDKVLLYVKAQKAIVYDPNGHKIVNVGPINIATQPNQAPQAKITLRNGTDINGLAAKAEAEIQKAFPGSNIVSKEQASRTNYDKTIVMAVDPLAKEAAEKLAKLYNVSTVSSLPDGETKPEGTDILIILGKDRVGQSENKTPSSPSPTQIPSPTPKK